MLVLSRKSGQRIVIGDEIVITIVKVRGNHVRLGIEAPDDVHIRREELEALLVGPRGWTPEQSAWRAPAR